MTTGILRTAYGIVWNDRPLPPFTTRELALTPFIAQSSTNGPGQNVSWSSSTVQYSTDLVCHPAVWKDAQLLGVEFDNGKGCRTSYIEPDASPQQGSRFSAYYIGYYYNDYLHFFLQGPNCTRDASHNFLAIWQRQSSNNTPDLTALFCEGSYYSQEVQANISLPDRSVLSVSSIGPKKILSDQEFNRSHFEYLLATGVREDSLVDPLVQQPEPNRVDLPDELPLDQSARLGNWSLTTPVTNMVAFAVAASRLRPEEYLQPDNLASAFQAAHRLTFALAIDSIMVSNNDTTNVISGWRASQVDTVFLSSTFTIIVQAALCIVLALTIYLLIFCRRRQSRLSSNPSSITAVMSLSRDPELLNLLRDLDEADSATFKKGLHQHRFRLHYSQKTNDNILGVGTPARGVSRVAEGKLASKSSATALISKSVRKTERPVELSIPVGLVFMSLLAILIAILIVLKYRTDQQTGKTSVISQWQLR